MHDISDLQHKLPSRSKLALSGLLAIVIAAAVLLLFVLPAEYGIDPTGIGARMGLTSLNQAAEETPVVETSEVRRQAAAYRENDLTVPLMPGSGAEIKAHMKAGDRFVFYWETGGSAVHFDMHGERPDANGKFTSYWLEDARSSAGGSFTAPFDGSHGWYWENRSGEVVNVKLKISGYYQDVFMP